jgi:hypothetical protein
MGTAFGPEPGRYLARRRRYVACGGEDTLKPDEQCIRLVRRRDGGRRNLLQLAVSKVVADPLGAIAQYSDVAAAGLLCPRFNVTGKLLARLLLDPAAAEVSLHLDHSRSNLNVYSAAITERRFEQHDFEIALMQLKWRRQE